MNLIIRRVPRASLIVPVIFLFFSVIVLGIVLSGEIFRIPFGTAYNDLYPDTNYVAPTTGYDTGVHATDSNGQVSDSESNQQNTVNQTTQAPSQYEFDTSKAYGSVKLTSLPQSQDNFQKVLLKNITDIVDIKCSDFYTTYYDTKEATFYFVKYDYHENEAPVPVVVNDYDIYTFVASNIDNVRLEQNLFEVVQKCVLPNGKKYIIFHENNVANIKYTNIVEYTSNGNANFEIVTNNNFIPTASVIVYYQCQGVVAADANSLYYSCGAGDAGWGYSEVRQYVLGAKQSTVYRGCEINIFMDETDNYRVKCVDGPAIADLGDGAKRQSFTANYVGSGALVSNDYKDYLLYSGCSKETSTCSNYLVPVKYKDIFEEINDTNIGKSFAIEAEPIKTTAAASNSYTVLDDVVSVWLVK